MKFLKTIFPLLIFFGGITAQSLSFKYYSVDDILPQNSVNTIIQDNKGYIWVGTEEGISVFDGIDYRFITVKEGLSHNHVNCIYQDSKGYYWISTNNGLDIYDGKKFLKGKKIFSELGRVYTVDEDNSGNIYFATRTKGLGIYNRDEDKLVFLTRKNGLPTDSLYKCMIDSKNNIWIGTVNKGIVKYNQREFTYFTKKDGLSSDRFFDIFEDSIGYIWVATGSKLQKYDGKSFSDMPEINDYISGRIWKIFEDSQHNFWICTKENGLIYFDKNSVTDYTDKSGLSSIEITAVLEDKRGDLWFGTRDGGISKLSVEKFEIYSKNEGLASDNVFAISVDNSGAVWFGHISKGITRISNGKVENITTADGIANNDVASIYTDSKGIVWIGTRAGLTKYQDGKYTNYTVKDGLAGNLVLSILEDRNNNLWLGTESGITKYDGRRFENLTGILNFPEDWVTDICEDFDGNLWFCLFEQGIAKLEGSKLIRYTKNEGLPTNEIFSAVQDRFGNMWFASLGGGLIKYDGREFENFTTANGLSSNSCYSLIEDGDVIYIGTARGISRFEFTKFDEKGNDAFKVYSTKDGLVSSEMNQGAYFQDKKRSLWFGTQKGVVKFSPSSQPRRIPSDVFITNVNVSDRESELDTIPAGKLELNYDQNNIRFDFGAVNFSAPEKTIYKYKLEGIDDNWSTTNQRSISYRSLPSQEYIFKVFCRNSDGVWSSKAATVTFIIFPPFWLTWWFLTILFVVLTISVYSIYIFKTKQVKKRNTELEDTVRSRTLELAIAKDKSDELLLNILPSILVDELKSNGVVKPREYKNVTILFTDFKGFTSTAAVLPPDKLVKELNELFKGFDYIVEKYDLEKMKTIGDSYMLAGGLPVELDDHSIRIVCAGLEMLEYVEMRNETSSVKWEMRVGVHSGQVVAGVVGSKKFTYDIWGDTVNIASRMESAGETGLINISAYTYHLIKDYFECNYRGKIEVKGKGRLDMYFVTGIKSDYKEKLLQSYNLSLKS